MTSEIAKLYLSGVNASEIGRRLHRTKQTILAHLRRQGITIRSAYETCSKLANIDHMAIVKEYLGGISQRQLGKKYGVETTTIGDLLDKYYIQKRGVRESVGYTPVSLPSTTTPEWWHFLGLILTDGWIYRRGYVTTLGFGSKDKILASYVRDLVSPGRTLYEDHGFYRVLNPINKDQLKLLGEYGCIERKSLVLAPTPLLFGLDNESFLQLLVGLIEGDGSIIYSNGVHRIYYYGTKTMCEYVRNQIGYGNIVKSKSIYRAAWTHKQARNLLASLMSTRIRVLDRKWSKANGLNTSE